MTIEEIRELNGDAIEARMAEIATELDQDDADLEALNAEVDALKERRAALIEAEENRKALAEKIVNGQEDVVVKEERKEEVKMTEKEIRNSQDYVHAFANYIKTGNDEECRALLTENANNGTVPVPEMVDSIIRHAWENEPILSRCRKTFVKGNLKVGFEISAGPATVHAEGVEVTEEELALGIVTMVPQTIKKWISVSDEVLDMDDGAFIEYIYSEVAYQIMKKLSGLVVADIIESADGNTVQAPSVTSTATTAATASIITAEGELSDEATDIVVIMTKADAAALKAAALSASYGYDPFDGLTVLTTSAADGHILVGDLSGAQVNFPNGEAPSFKYDDNTLATKDLVRIIGRLPAAHAVTAPGRFVDIVLA